MGNSLDGNLFLYRKHRLHIDFSGGQQGLSDGFSAQTFVGRFDIAVLDIKNLADQGESIGMDAAGGKCNDDISGLNGGIIDHFLLIYDTDCKTGQVIFIHRVEAGHLCGLSADQRSAGLNTALGNAGNNGGDPVGIVLSACDVIQEEQRAGTAADDVIDTHGHAVDADGVVFIHQKCDAQFGTDAVCAGDQDRLFHAGQVGLKQSAKAADRSDHTLCGGSCDMALH